MDGFKNKLFCFSLFLIILGTIIVATDGIYEKFEKSEAASRIVQESIIQSERDLQKRITDLESDMRVLKELTHGATTASPTR